MLIIFSIVSGLLFYEDNKEFFNCMVEWKKLIFEADEQDEPRPPLSDYIGECFMKIAERLSHKSNFSGYSYREEMISDGIENCIMYAHNFNPEKSKNPFSYFTQIIYYAFLRRIEKEKKQSYIKFRMLEEADKDGAFFSWYKENYFAKNKEVTEKFEEEVIKEEFNLTPTDVEKFTPKKKKKKEPNLNTTLQDESSEDSNNK